MAKKNENGADLQAALRAAADPAAREVIEYLPYDLIDPDPDNFYSIEALDKLADSIATVGLLDPIRVRHSQTDGGHYVVTSGHRRRAAIKLLIDSGEEGWRNAVPCIVDRGERTPEWHELRLIFANSTSRQLSSAEMSLQAKRVEELLVSLKEQGYDFPGRMQEHVAAAMNTSASKLKRLHAIRNNLAEPLLKRYDAGQLVEDAAYSLQQLPADAQIAIGWECDAREEKHRANCVPVAGSVKEVLRRLEAYQKPMPCRAHAGGPECHHHVGKIVRSCFEPYSWNVCPEDRCCMDCHNGCRSMCAEAKARRQLEQAVEKEKQAERDKAEEADRETRRQKVVRRAKQLLPLVEAKGLTGKIFDFYSAPTGEQIRQWATGDTGDDHFYGSDFMYPGNAANIRLMCSRLGCTPEFALGMSDEPFRKEEAKEEAKAEAKAVQETKAAAAPEWQKGNPPISGWYLVWSTWLDFRHADYEMLFWSGDHWTEGDRGRKSKSKVLAWFRVPQKTGAPTGEEAET